MSEFDDSIQPWLAVGRACECGKTHAVSMRRVVIEDGALDGISGWLREEGLRSVLLVADARTMVAAGARLASLLEVGGIRVDVCRIADGIHGDLIADEDAVAQVMVALSPEVSAVLAVGSGTLHDIVRFVCHRSGRAFVSVPTAASVDGFVSTGAPLVLRGFKQTIPAAAPDAVFADLDILTAAPRCLTAAGFGDMLGKFTSLADWRLGRLLLDEPFCPVAADLTRRGLGACLDSVEDIAAGNRRGVGRLMEGLILSGIAMLLVGNSRPASGAEHHLSHFWEMRYLQQGRPAELHGAKVGVACGLMAGLYQTIRHLPIRDVETAMDSFRGPTPEEQSAAIVAAFGSIAPSVIAENAGAPTPLPCNVEERWAEVRAIADSVPAPEQIEGWLRRAGGPAAPADLGLPVEMVAESTASAMYVRARFSILRLAAMLNIAGTKPA